MPKLKDRVISKSMQIISYMKCSSVPFPPPPLSNDTPHPFRIIHMTCPTCLPFPSCPPQRPLRGSVLRLGHDLWMRQRPPRLADGVPPAVTNGNSIVPAKGRWRPSFPSRRHSNVGSMHLGLASGRPSGNGNEGICAERQLQVKRSSCE